VFALFTVSIPPKHKLSLIVPQPPKLVLPKFNLAVVAQIKLDTNEVVSVVSVESNSDNYILAGFILFPAFNKNKMLPSGEMVILSLKMNVESK